MNGVFGLLLKKHRENQGFSMGELARLSKTTIPTISLVEAGTRTPPKASAARWARALALTGQEKKAFMALATRAKWKKSDVFSRVLKLEADRTELVALLEMVIGESNKRGQHFSQDVMDRLEVLRKPI